jgi:hypothetical protein
MLEMLERVFGPLRRYTAEFYSECAEEAWQSDFFEKDGKKSFFVVLLSDEEDPCFMVYLWREEGFFWISKSSNDVFKTEPENQRRTPEVNIMRKMSFDSTPKPAFESLTELWAVTQQLAFALLVQDLKTATAASQAWPAADPNKPSPEKILQWAEDMRKDISPTKMVQALVGVSSPLMNTHSGFISGTLEGIAYPNRIRISLYSLLESILNDHIKGRVPLKFGSDEVEDEKEVIAAEMARRGVPGFQAGEVLTLSLEEAREFLSQREATLLILEHRILCLMRKTGRDERGMFLYRETSREGKSVLVRGRSGLEAEREAQRTLGEEAQVRGVQIDFDAWVDLGGD